MQLPFLTEYDPLLRAEGSLDPLGLYTFADTLGVQLTPGIRERQRMPRYLTIVLAGLAACAGELPEPGGTADIPESWLVFEWLVVEALVRQGIKDGTPLKGIPGRGKVTATVRSGDTVNSTNYLKSPAVFGFHGIYRILGTNTGLFDKHQILKAGELILSAWEADQGLAGFRSSNGNGAVGAELRKDLLSWVRYGMQHKHTKPLGSAGWEKMAKFFNPHKTGPLEAAALWNAIKGDDPMRSEYATKLISRKGQAAWRKAEGSHAVYHNWLVGHCSTNMKGLISAIQAFEHFARLLQDAFNEILWMMSNSVLPLPTAALSTGKASTRAGKEITKAFANAAAKVQGIDPVLAGKFSDTFDWTAHCTSTSFSAALLTHHVDIQGAKAPDGKLPWVQFDAEGKVKIRPKYHRPAFDSAPGRYVHTYRIAPIWSFACHLGKAKPILSLELNDD
jgi:hypothetical protein